MAHVVFTPAAQQHRFYDDGTESGSSPLATQNNNITLNVDAGDYQVQLRYLVQETGGAFGKSSDDWTLEYEVDGGGVWTTITAASSRIQADTGSTLTDGGVSTDRAADGITGGSGGFTAGEQEAGDGEITDWGGMIASAYTEHVWGLLVIKNDNSDAEVLGFRMRLNGGSMGNTRTPTITIEKAASTRRIFHIT